MSWLDSDEKVLRAETERKLELLISNFIYEKEQKGETWEEGEIMHTPARIPFFKAYSVIMRRR